MTSLANPSGVPEWRMQPKLSPLPHSSVIEAMCSYLGGISTSTSLILAS